MHKRPSLMKSACLLLALASLTFAAPLSKAQNPVTFQLEKGGRANLPGGTWIEAKAPCSLSVMMDGETIKEITVTPVDVSSRTIEFTTNKAINTPNYRITTIWDDSKGEETFIVRMKAPSAKPSVTFEVKDGPITSDEEFFTEVLNLDFPGLAEVKAAAVKKDWTGARTAYVKYLKTRKTPVWSFDWRDKDKPESRIEGFDTKRADDAASNLLTSCDVPYQFGSHVNWSINPTPLEYCEWPWQLSRHPFWRSLGMAYWATGDEKYAKAFVSQMRGWIIDNPLPDYPARDEYSRWRTIEAGIRTSGSWPDAFFRFLGSPSFDDESILMMVKSFYEHGKHLRAHRSAHNNWLTMEMNGLYHISTLFPEFKSSEAWGNFVVETLLEEERIQFYPDNTQVELAPNYHGVSLNNILAPYRLAKLNGKQFPAEYMKNLEGMYDYYLKIVLPCGHMPALNESGTGNGWYDCRRPLATGFGLFPERTDFQYVATSGKEGTVPSFTSSWMPWAGWYVMRSGWTADALHAHFEVGPYSGAHSQEDKLSIILEAYGNRILTEAGTYPYDESQWRKYAASARGHNLTRVDGKDQNRGARAGEDLIRYSRKPLGNRWISNDRFDFGEGWYTEGFGRELDSTVTQYRALLFLKDKCWLMFDVFTPKDGSMHSYETSFHLDAPGAKVNEALKSVTGERPGEAVLSVIPVRKEGLEVQVITGQEKPEVQGWAHDETTTPYGVKPVATPVFSRKASGQWVEPYILWPVKAGGQCPVSGISAKGAGRFTVNFTDGSSITVNATVSGDKLGSLSYTTKGKGRKSTVKVF